MPSVSSCTRYGGGGDDGGGTGVLLRAPGFPGQIKVSVPSQTLAGLSEHCSPLLEGCRKNRQQWQHLAEECEQDSVNGVV